MSKILDSVCGNDKETNRLSTKVPTDSTNETKELVIENSDNICGNDKETNRFSTVVPTEYAPTKETKGLILGNRIHIRVRNRNGVERPRDPQVTEGVCLYQDYEHKYCLRLYEGHISLAKFHRRGASLEYDSRNYNIISVGRCASINDIVVTENFKWQENYSSSLQVHPYTGYIFRYTTENKEEFHIRLYIASYVLGAEDVLTSITVQYGLMQNANDK